MNSITMKETEFTKQELDLLSFALSSVTIRGDQAIVMISLVDKINKAVNENPAEQKN